MLLRSMRGALALAAAGLAAASPAFVLIDDFTVGEYHGRIDWPDNSDIYEVSGLDRSHCVLGSRRTHLDVQSNFHRAPLFVDVGGGTNRVSYRSTEMATLYRTIIFGISGETVDLSAETRIYCEVLTEEPENRFANEWSIRIVDANGNSGSNGFFLTEVGSIYFERRHFSGNVDWSRIKNLSFSQSFSRDIGPVPQAYAVNRIYAVPEPSVLAVAPALLALALRRRQRAAA